MSVEAKLLAEGAESLGLVLDDYQISKFSTFMTELSKWNRKINLTAIRASGEIVVKHMLDSLTLASYLQLNGRVLDIGSGAGFPSIPLGIVRNDLAILSVDAVQKKIMFQKHVARMLKLEKFRAVHARVEDLSPEYENEFDFILSRAFSSIKTFVELSLPMLADGGRIVAMKGVNGKSEALSSEPDLARLKMKIEKVIEFVLPVSGDSRSLIVMMRDYST